MNEQEIKEAIKQVMIDCDLLVKQENYDSVSLRGVLTKLGYTHDQTVDVIFYVAEQGWTYCLDNIVESSNGLSDGGKEFPSQSVCYYGPDQLKSRLYAVTPGISLR